MMQFRKNQHAIEATEDEIIQMTSDMKDAHRDSLADFRSSVQSWNDSEGDEPAMGLSRRSFLTGAGLFAAGGILVASGGVAAASTTSRLAKREGLLASTAVPASSIPLDVKVAALAASLENLAVATYAAALTAAHAGKLGTVPNAVATFAKTAMAQHNDHGAAWNAMIASSGYEKITAPNATIGRSVNAAFAKVTDVPGVAMLALSLEEAAAATYLEAVGVVSGKAAIETAATIQPVEMQHAAVLNFVLGNYPVPSAFASTTSAAKLSDTPSIHRR